MAIDTHLKVEGVEGEATHADHKGEIDVLSWRWDVTNVGSGGKPGTGSGQGKATPGDFIFKHNYDKSSPILAKACASGKHFATVVLTARKAGEGQKDFLKVSMKEVFITSVHPSASDDGAVSEEVSFGYKHIEFGYKPQDDKGGLGGEVKFGWDVSTTAVS